MKSVDEHQLLSEEERDILGELGSPSCQPQLRLGAAALCALRPALGARSPLHTARRGAAAISFGAGGLAGVTPKSGAVSAADVEAVGVWRSQGPLVPSPGPGAAEGGRCRSEEVWIFPPYNLPSNIAKTIIGRRISFSSQPFQYLLGLSRGSAK